MSCKKFLGKARIEVYVNSSLEWDGTGRIWLHPRGCMRASMLHLDIVSPGLLDSVLGDLLYKRGCKMFFELASKNALEVSFTCFQNLYIIIKIFFKYEFQLPRPNGGGYAKIVRNKLLLFMET